MTAGFGVLDLTPQPLQDDRFQVGFYVALLPAIRTAMRRLLAKNFRSPRQLKIRQLPGDFVADLGGQFFDCDSPRLVDTGNGFQPPRASPAGSLLTSTQTRKPHAAFDHP